jgi:hypothetical protein
LRHQGREQQLDGTRGDDLGERKLALIAPILVAPGAKQQDDRAIQQADGGVGERDDRVDRTGYGKAGEQNAVDHIAQRDRQNHSSAEAAFRHGLGGFHRTRYSQALRPFTATWFNKSED